MDVVRIESDLYSPDSHHWSGRRLALCAPLRGQRRESGVAQFLVVRRLDDNKPESINMDVNKLERSYV
jgi:hypothetical protein